MIKVAIAGVRGRMGTAAVKAIQDTEDIQVVAALDYKYNGLYLNNTEVKEEPKGIPIYTSFDELVSEARPDVLLDLTGPDAVYQNMYNAITQKVRPVVGTSGLSYEEIAKLADLSSEQQVGGIIAPNFSIGAVLMMKFSAMAARYLQDVEIIEMHHDQKLDAPSGTATKTAELIMDIRKPHKQGHPDEEEMLQGARGADVDGMKIHSVRLPGLLAHQKVLFGGEGELLTIQHDSFNRDSFMPGVLLSIRQVMNQEELVYGLENIIE